MKKIFYCIFAFIVATGCYEDKSSDLYDPIGTIEITGVEEEYSLITGAEALEIAPAVTSTDPADNVAGFEYLWTCYSNTEASSTSAVIDTIAHTKDIAWLVALKPGNYTVRLRVTNPANGYAAYLTTSLSVSTEYSNGFYFLKETAAGNTELDFHKPDPDEEGKWITAPDILEAQLGAPITGLPASLGMISSYPYINSETGEAASGSILVPMSEKDMKVMLLDDMSLVYNHNEIFFDGEAPDHKPLRVFYLSMFGYSVFLFDDGAYVVSSSSQTGKVGFSTAPDNGCRLIQGIVSDGGFPGYGGMMMLFFDELNGQLVYYDYAGSLMDLSGTPSPFNITHRPLFMGSSGWCVFHDPNNTSDRYLYFLNGDVMFGATMPINEIRPINAATTPNFNSAEVYGSNKTNAQFLYGSKGDKLYMYNTGNDTEKQLAPSGFGAGEQITMITHKRGVHNPADRTDTDGFLFIATHQDGNYKVYMYKVIGGEPDGAPFIIEGEGKVTDMQYAGGASAYNSSLSVNY